LRHTDDEAVVEVVAESAMPAEGSPSAMRVLFGPFVLSTAERSLKKAGEVVPLGGRAFDILTVLIDKAGEVVSKDELIAKAWPDVTVEEGSLRVHLSALRKALGDGQFGTKYIENVQGRGYCFVVPIKRQADDHHQGNTSSSASNLPPPLSRMIGRDDAVRDIRTMHKSQRLTTILGAGGIGKTTVALAVGHAALAGFTDQVFFVDLSAVKDNEQVIGAIATAIGLDPQFVDPEEALLRSLSQRKALIILDSCEHLIETTAKVADCIFQRAPDISMLATSREALQIAGNRLHLRTGGEPGNARRTCRSVDSRGRVDRHSGRIRKAAPPSRIVPGEGLGVRVRGHARWSVG
jgi:DNA-binding winged helix-turn-helix (wHTH) protein